MNTTPSFIESATTLARLMERHPVIRAVNFHNTPRSRAAEYDEQLGRLARDFSPVTEADLDRHLELGEWNKPKPGVIISVYEGYRNGFDVLVPLLERHGLVGWFFIITGFLNAQPGEQLAFAADHDIGMATREYPDGRYAMSWNEVRELDGRHVIASHTRSHVSLAGLESTERESEIVGAQRDLEAQLQHPARAFAAYGGTAYGEDPDTDLLIDAAKYQFVFSNLKIQRRGKRR